MEKKYIKNPVRFVSDKSAPEQLDLFRPIAGIVRVLEHTFEFNLLPNYILANYEYRFREVGEEFTNWMDVVSNPIQLPNINIAKGDLEIRIKLDVPNPINIQMTNYTEFYKTTDIYFGYSDTIPDNNNLNLISLQWSKRIESLLEEYSLSFEEIANLKYIVIKEEITESVKTIWFNTEYNEGEIPGSKLNGPFIKDNYRYYVSKVPFSLDGEILDVIFKVN